jgi:beta-lactamase regulating signal transducer with metallopeptidase domain
MLVNAGSHLRPVPRAKAVAVMPLPVTITQIVQPFRQVKLPAPAPHHIDWIPVALLTLWACGLACIVIIRLRGWLHIRAAIQSSSPMPLASPIPVRSTPGLREPGVVGLLSPVLLLPAGIANRLTPAQLDAVIAHEAQHVARRDNLNAALHMMVEMLFWFHPFVWWIGARLIAERERACDEAVLRLGCEPILLCPAAYFENSSTLEKNGKTFVSKFTGTCPLWSPSKISK